MWIFDCIREPTARIVMSHIKPQAGRTNQTQVSQLCVSSQELMRVVMSFNGD